MCVRTHVGVQVCTRVQKKVSESLELEVHVTVSHSRWVLGTVSSLLQEQCVLLSTQPLFQPLNLKHAPLCHKPTMKTHNEHTRK